ncbi:gephyrin-like molybdotransferase Glp, partial [Propionicimonas sp.]|uniref:molybdopterin molybdotransferase MoeA n=1 Tax=Propionicimonas sp. TaxID=1955623 RepID=UPI0039E27336
APRWLAGPPGPAPRSLAAHRELLLSQVASLRPFGIGLLDAAGLALCESIVADLDLPTFTSATTDGWAVRASNLVGASTRLPVVLPVVDEIGADGYRGAPLSKGTAVRVSAGAPVPEGADAVVPLADGLVAGEEVQFVAEARFQQHMLLAGTRISDGDQLVAAGTELTPRVLGLIAEVGHDKVLARPRPRVVVMTADSSLVEPGLPLTRWTETYDGCTTLLAASARHDGAQVFTAGVVASEPAALVTTLTEQLVRADLVLVVTDASDELVEALGQQGAVDVTEVDVLPGRQVFALLGDDSAPVLILPAGAVPAYLAYLLLGRPLVQRLAGQEVSGPRAVDAPVAAPLEADPDRPRLVLGSHGSRGVVPLPAREPGTVELARANAVILVPPGAGEIPAHGDVTCWLLD